MYAPGAQTLGPVLSEKSNRPTYVYAEELALWNVCFLKRLSFEHPFRKMSPTINKKQDRNPLITGFIFLDIT